MQQLLYFCRREVDVLNDGLLSRNSNIASVLSREKMHALFRRKYRTLVLLMVVAVLFYLLQCFTVSRLGQHLAAQPNLHIYHEDNRDNLEGDIFDNKKSDINVDSHQYIPKDKNSNLIAHKISDSEVKLKDKIKEHKISYSKVKLKDEIKEHKISDSEVKLKDKIKEHEKNLSEYNNIKLKKEKVKYQENDNFLHLISNDNDETPCQDVQPSKGFDAMNMVKDERLIAASVNLLGVLESEKYLYKVDDKNMLACSTATQVRISRQQVNDDYCDCPDSFDEPGTSACPNNKFYCTQQMPGSPSQYVVSSKVNDGICDCCDGSDEWLGALVPNFMKIEGDMPLGAVYHAPCPNKCGEILAVRNKEQFMQNKGREIQKQYLKMASLELTETKRKSYGPNGVFFPLSKHCFKLRVSQYEYSVCPFEKVSQEIFPHSPVILGRKSSIISEKGQYVLVMDDGDKTLCPFGRARKTKIYMFCGLEDKIMKVTEPELCEYAFTMSTPAVC